MSDDDGNVLFVRGNDQNNDDNDIWDDTLLIKAYDKAVNLAKEEVAKRLSLETSSNSGVNKLSKSKQQQNKKSQKKWTVGSPCRAIYSVDNEEYEAIITHIFNNNSGTCIVKFVGYGNTEKVQLSSLTESEGLASQTAQAQEAETMKSTSDIYSEPEIPEFTSHNQSSSSSRNNNEKMDYIESDLPKNLNNNCYPDAGLFSSSSFGCAPPAPPLPPQLMARLPTNDADALSSMLMSWYISGFHTGFYHGMKQSEKNNTNRQRK